MVEALELPLVSATPTRVAAPSNVMVDKDSVSARPAAEFGWGGGGDGKAITNLAETFGGHNFGGFSNGIRFQSLHHSYTSLNGVVDWAPTTTATTTDSSSGAFDIASVFQGSDLFAGQLPCPAGSYCVKGRRHLCPVGRYGVKEESDDETCDGECSAG